ncbi:MAG: hypothetical protein NZ937_05615 [Armatimonadetes bacterium]|nr:hypothetical protein [Armatimonadota bacterium]
MREKDLYLSVANWLRDFLKGRYPKAINVWAEDTSRINVAKFLRYHNLLDLVPWGAMLEISTDVTGAALVKAKEKQIVKLAIVEVKIGAINLRDFSQILGYAKVVIPDHAFIISPKGWTPSLHRLVRDFKRVDILEYAPGKLVVVAKWDHLSNSVRPGDVLLHGIF